MLNTLRAQAKSKMQSFLAGPIAAAPQPVVVPDDLSVHANGAVYDPATHDLDYLWFDVAEHLDDGVRRYVKVIRLVMLTYLPSREREQSTVLLEMQKALKAVNTARIDLVCLSVNILDPDIGVVQIYGAQACAASIEEAAQQAAQGLAVVVATLRAAYQQAIFKPLTDEIGEWLRLAFQRMPFALVVRGQPDPRVNVRGPQLMDAFRTGARQSEVGLQQVEYVYRGMVAGGHEFANVILLSRAGDERGEDIFRLQERLATEMSIWGSKMQYTRSINAGLAIPIALQGVIGRGASAGYSAGEGQSVQRSQGAAVGQAHSDSVSVSDVWGRATSTGESWSTAHTTGHGETTATSTAHSTGVADGTSHSVGQAHMSADTHGSSSGTSTTHGTSSGVSQVASSGQSWSNGVSGGGGISLSPLGIGASGKMEVSHSDGGSIGLADGVSSGVMDSTTTVNMTSHAHTEANTTSVADGTSHSVSSVDSVSTSRAVSNFESDTQAHGTSVSETQSYAHGVGSGQSDTQSASAFGSQGSSESIGLARSQALSAAMSQGLGIGLVPSLGFSRSYQGIDYVAKAVHDALLQQYRLIETMALEGGVFVDNYYLVPTPEARAALKGLVAQAFHGIEDVATPVQVLDLTPEEEAYIRLHALTCVPSTMPERSPWALEGWRHTSLNTMLQAAALTAPGLFEHGAALTVWEPLPALANVALHFRRGTARLGQLISPETGEVRTARVALTEQQLFAHWLIAADTRFGKTVLAQRAVHEMLLHHQCRIVVCDFAAGWRDLISVVERSNRLDYGSLYPSAAWPLHFNFLRVGPHVAAADTLSAILDLTAVAGQFGERQFGFLRQTLTDVYLENGVLTNEPWVLDDLAASSPALIEPPTRSKKPVKSYQPPQKGVELWGWLRPAERDLINTRRRSRGERELPAGPIRLRDLHPNRLIAMDDRHAIASLRSRQVDVRRWVARLIQLRDSFQRMPTSYDSIQGILNRMDVLGDSELGELLGAGDDSLMIEDLAWPQGIAIIEAGAGGELSAFVKSLVFLILMWRVYRDAVQRWALAQDRGERVPHTVIVLEEANKIYGSVDSTAKQKETPRASTILPDIHRDSGKYNITLMNLCQSPAEVPDPVRSSSNNAAISALKGDRDAQTAMSALGFSPHGMHDVSLYRFITGKMVPAQFIMKFSLNADRTQVAPFLLRPLKLDLPRVTDTDLVRQFDPTTFLQEFV